MAPSGDEVLVTLDYDVYHARHTELLNELVECLTKDLGYAARTDVTDEHMFIYVSKKETPTVSKPVFRAVILVREIGGKALAGWQCDHEHRELRAAARCGQLEVQRRLPNTSDKAKLFRFEEVTTSYEVKGGAAGDAWVNAQYYRTYVAK
ncbi:hypothetical protein [Microbispora sp. NPDC049633]|uniref:hypothetical protein n=1 Tax=Microbispora sp. NPDC049633 TaxID=3154355 RepID=UPI003434B277